MEYVHVDPLHQFHFRQDLHVDVSFHPQHFLICVEREGRADHFRGLRQKLLYSLVCVCAAKLPHVRKHPTVVVVVVDVAVAVAVAVVVVVDVVVVIVVVVVASSSPSPSHRPHRRRCC